MVRCKRFEFVSEIDRDEFLLINDLQLTDSPLRVRDANGGDLIGFADEPTNDGGWRIDIAQENGHHIRGLEWWRR